MIIKCLITAVVGGLDDGLGGPVIEKSHNPGKVLMTVKYYI